MQIIQAGLGFFSDVVVDEIEVFMNAGFKSEPEGRIFDATRFKTMLRAVLDNIRSVAFLLLDNIGRCHGVFVGVVAPDMVTSDMLGTQLVWRVADSGKGFGMELLAKFVEWCKENGATKIVASGGHGEFNMRFEKKLINMQFRPAIWSWMREV